MARRSKHAIENDLIPLNLEQQAGLIANLWLIRDAREAVNLNQLIRLTLMLYGHFDFSDAGLERARTIYSAEKKTTPKAPVESPTARLTALVAEKRRAAFDPGVDEFDAAAFKALAYAEQRALLEAARSRHVQMLMLMNGGLTDSEELAALRALWGNDDEVNA